MNKIDNNEIDVEDKVELEDVENHVIKKGGLYAGLTGNTKGFTIFIIICSIVMIGFIIYTAIKLG